MLQKKGEKFNTMDLSLPARRSIYIVSKIDRKINLCETIDATGWDWWYFAFAESGFTLQGLGHFHDVGNRSV